MTKENEMDDGRFMKLFGFVMIGVLIVACILAVTSNMPDERDLSHKHYCEMVDIYRSTNGDFGWPDYNNSAHTCKGE
jgi:hypothetical protein